MTLDTQIERPYHDAMSVDGSPQPAPRQAASGRGDTTSASQPSGRSGRRGRWLWLIVALGLGVGKAHAAEEVLRHRDELIAVLGSGLAVSVLRFRLMWVALAAAALFAVCINPHPLGLVLAYGAGAFAVLIATFLLISTVLRVRQERVTTR